MLRVATSYLLCGLCRDIRSEQEGAKPRNLPASLRGSPSASRMAALHSSAFRSLENLHTVSGKPQPDVVKKAASFPTLRHVHYTCSLTWASGLRSPEGNVSMKLSAIGGAAAASSVDMALESDIGVSYEKLQELLAASEWELADEETRRLIIVLAGENAVKRKYVFFSEVKFIPNADLGTIDRLWRTYSKGKFGYSVQRKIMKRVNGDCSVFFKKVGWVKPLAADSPQFTYRSFPSEFEWELAPSTPEGHLPLTNALRGTQLLKCLLDHPAFEFADEDLQVPLATSSDPLSGKFQPSQQQQQQKKPLSIDYSF